MNKGFTIAIDGPVASGKGTLAPNLAKKLNGFYLDTGAMYRCVALYALENHIDPNNKEEIEKVAKELDIDFSEGHTFIDGRDVSNQIRGIDISRLVPTVAGYGEVRTELIKKQRKIAERVQAEGKIFIAEGRDIGSIVLPDADFKLFLTATPEERAKRRQEQLGEQGVKVDFESILKDVNDRDKKDIEINKTLVTDPEKFGYEILDNSDMKQEETLNAIIKLLIKRGLV